MAACNAAHQGTRTRRGTDLDVARVTAAAPLGDQAVALAALHQCKRRLVAGLQAFGQLAERATAAPVEAVQVQQQQILRRRPALGARGRIAEVQELRTPEAELRQGFELRFSEHARCRRDGRGIYKLVVYFAKAPAGGARDRESSTRRRGVHRVSPQAGPGTAERKR